MLTPTSVATWLAGLGLSVPVKPGPLPEGKAPVTPDVIAIVSPVGGAAPSVEGTFDAPAFQVAVRGPQRRTYDETAFNAAWEADRLIRFAPLPGHIGSVWCVSVMRSSGPPTLVAPSPDTAERMYFTASYIFLAHAL